jgi:hypothetical protein
MDYIHRGFTHILVFNPTHANILAKAGWSKAQIEEFISEFARNPVVRQLGPAGTPSNTLYQGRIVARVGETVRIIRDPRTIRIIVAGGPGAFIAHVYGGGPTPGKAEIQKIDLPSNWDKLVAKYQDYEPNYVRY